jgi:hypothetical protein
MHKSVEAVMRDNVNVRIMRENPYVRPLEHARRVAGGDEELAAALRTSTQALSTWLSGEAPPPMKTYMAALSLVARGNVKSHTAIRKTDGRSAHAGTAHALIPSAILAVVTARGTGASLVQR